MTGRSLLALAALIGPLGMAASVLTVPYAFGDPPAEWIPKIADAGGQTEASFWGLLVWGLVAPVGAIVTGLVARRGSRRLATTGMVLAFLGITAFGAGGYAYDGIALAASNAGLDTPAVEELLEKVDELQAPLVMSSVLIPTMFVGVILLGIALWRGGDVPRWAAAALIATPPLILAGGFVSMILNAAGFVLMAAGFGAAGLAYARGVDGPPAGSRARWTLAIAGAAAPMFMGIWALAVPSATTDTYAEGLPKLAAAAGRVELSLWMLLAFALTATTGAIVVGLVARQGSPRLGTAGMALTFAGFGALNFGGYAFLGGSLASIRAGNPDEVTVRILEEMEEFTVALGAAVFLPLMFAGVVMLGIALWRGRAVPRWAAVVLIAAFPLIAVGGAVSMQLNAVGWLMLAIGFGVAGAAFARQSHAPTR